MGYTVRSRWKLMVMYMLVLAASLSNGLHLGNVDQKKNVKQLTKKINEANGHSSSKKIVENSSATKNTSGLSPTSMTKLQLEIQELLRMQKQLKSEMVPGADNPKKIKLLQHIQTQIQLRRMQQSIDKNQQLPKLSKQSNVDVNTQNQAVLHKSHSVGDLNVAPTIQTDSQPIQKISDQQEQTIQNIQNSQYQKQHQEIQQLKQQKQKLTERSQYTVQSKRKNIAPLQNSIQQTYINEPALFKTGQNLRINEPSMLETSQNMQMKEAAMLKSGQNMQMNYVNSDLMYNGLNQQNQQSQIQAMPPSAFVQQRVPIQLNNPIDLSQPQISFVDTQLAGMKQGGAQLDSSQHVLVPLNALAVNNLVPRNAYSGERFIVLDTSLQDNMQLAMAGNPLVVQAEKKITTEKPTTSKPPTTKPSTQAQQITKPATQKPTTVTTLPPTTHAPTPPTTERFAYAPVPVNNDIFKHQFYNGELQRQQLEITKLKLEIRALRRKEIAAMQIGQGEESENEDAPPRRRNMMRFRQRGMPFRFF